MIIYGLIDPRSGELRYVGKTVRTAHRRLRRHLAASYLMKEDTYKARWLRQLAAAGLEPEVEVLERVATKEHLCEAERFHIAYWRYIGADLTNTTAGGDGIGLPHTAASREKIRAALTGKPKSPEHRERLKIANRRVINAATRAAWSAARRGRNLFPNRDDAYRLAMRDAKGGRAFLDQHGTRYESQKGAARALGLNVAHINAVLHGQRRSTGGYVFRFVSAE